MLQEAAELDKQILMQPRRTHRYSIEHTISSSTFIKAWYHVPCGSRTGMKEAHDEFGAMAIWIQNAYHLHSHVYVILFGVAVILMISSVFPGTDDFIRIRPGNA